MGNQQIKPILEAMQALLRQRKLKIPERVLCNFLKEIDRVAPWFVSTGSLTKGSWAKLGIDLTYEKEKGKLRPGTWPIYKMIRACIEDDKCQDKVKEGQKALTEHQDSLSEAEKEGDRNNKGRSPMKKLKPKKRKEEKKNMLYPVLDEFKNLKVESTSSEETSSEESNKEEEVTSSETELDPDEQAELDKEAAKYESERYDLDPPYAPGYEATAPPLEEVRRKKQKGEYRISSSLIPKKERKRIRAAFPVWEDEDKTRQYSQLDLKQLKGIAEAVQTYGVNASFTQALIDRLTSNAMTPDDWYNTVKACLTMGQYLDWKSIFQDMCATQARQNAAQGQPVWNFDMLTGQGQWVANQTQYPAEVYNQINRAAVKAWKSLPNKGQIAGNLTKIIQGNNEPFSDFVARMLEAAGRIFGDPEAAMPLVEQLVFEQCTRECRNAITPWKGKGLNAWMKACREIGGPLSNAGLAAAFLSAQKTSTKKCFNCGRIGHIQRQCRMSNHNPNSGNKQPDVCPRCNKGKHWANECRSVKDNKGRPIIDRPKNGQRGPRPQGPQIYGAIDISQSRRQGPQKKELSEGLRQAQQDWTCAPPPEQY